ncbi:exonuclease [Virgibacillus profundi]|uniref:Nuclease SbcCD subunit C n=1 Tax=Virgibacillus profundi TaxID=2024555 RepID=A0A2A2IB63_9BACI|nr:SMC family ATPase [Virgibacillus profundi]PAV28867.1 exonuclease [Virgibacillus profundi]PXY53035.1 SMC family ATPase [Virgibacillus profundi]
MKPLKLRMTAFGPYKNIEIIDFNELEQNNLFVISGNTGAGKTTIFDGICFALYGSASGTDREDNRMLRSDFADDNTHTSVELEFELKGRFYRILRQLGHVKLGNKSRTGEKYEFFEKVDGKEIPCVDRQMVSEIDRKVEEIVGLTKDQFKQIVMLPQGEFRKLLTSETENKEAILRRLFKTENYKHLSELLKNKKNIIMQEFNQVNQMRDNYIQSISNVLPKREESLLFDVLSSEHYNVNQIVTGLEEEAGFYRNQIELDQKKYEDTYHKHDGKQTAFHQAKALNERFEELENKENQLKELHIQSPVFTKKEKQLEDAERAGNIEVFEKQAKEWRKEEKEKSVILDSAKNAGKNADGRFEKAEMYYKQEESNKSKREETSKKLDRLTEYLPILKDIDERKRGLQELEIKGKKSASELEIVKKNVKEKNEAIEENNGKIKSMDDAVSQLTEKQQTLNEMREQAKVLMDFIKINNRQIELDKDLHVKETAFRKIKTKYDDQELVWVNNQASLLATHLHDGEACPVCGSLDHPGGASDEEEMVTKEQLEILKKELDEKDGLYRSAVADLKANSVQMEEKGEEVANYNIHTDQVTEVKNSLVDQGIRLKEEVDQLKKLREALKQLKSSVEKENVEVKELDAKKEQLDKLYQDLRTSYETSRALYKEKLNNVPKEVRVLSELEKQISETKALKLKLEKAWDEAQTMFQQAKEEQTRAASNLEHAKNQLEETKAKHEKAENQFKDALRNASFESEESYHQAKMSEADREKWKDEIRKFNQHLSALTQQVNELRDALKEKKRIDLTVLQQELKELKQAYELALSKLQLSKENYQEATNLKVNIIDAESQVKEHESQLSTITDLYDVIRGQNSQKISFERYLQIEYLEQIIEAANGRLARLSNGQFNLIRSDRQESHGKQSGLALDVYDSYTGQTRDVKTLSGGEKFNASLCLALGMSDVIQSFQGNITINTMFIDEGFGSLDEESLNKSIDTLIDLQQSGRMIGVISHVQELKTMFPAILEVTKTKEGYSKSEFVLK